MPLPELLFCRSAGIPQRLTSKQNCGKQVGNKRKYSKQPQTDNGKDTHGADSKASIFCYPCADAEDPAVLAILIKTMRIFIWRLPGPTTHYLFLHSGDSLSRIVSSDSSRASILCAKFQRSSIKRSSPPDISRDCFHFVMKCKMIRNGAGIARNTIRATNASCDSESITYSPPLVAVLFPATRCLSSANSLFIDSSASSPANSW